MDRRIVAEWIVQYIARHPTAKDTAQGVVFWCFASGAVRPSQAVVQEALDDLVRDKRVGSSLLVDGVRVYHAL